MNQIEKTYQCTLLEWYPIISGAKILTAGGRTVFIQTEDHCGGRAIGDICRKAAGYEVRKEAINIALSKSQLLILKKVAEETGQI